MNDLTKYLDSKITFSYIKTPKNVDLENLNNHNKAFTKIKDPIFTKEELIKLFWTMHPYGPPPNVISSKENFKGSSVDELV